MLSPVGFQDRCNKPDSAKLPGGAKLVGIAGFEPAVSWSQSKKYAVLWGPMLFSCNSRIYKKHALVVYNGSMPSYTVPVQV
jgi:hypothetical protein